MRVRRLGWAGLEVEAGGRTLMIDYVRDLTPLFTGWRPGPALPAPTGQVTAALLTHLHRDHTEAAALAEVLPPGAPVLRPAPGPGDELDNLATVPVERELRERGLATEILEPWESRRIGPFDITAVPAVDGLGDPQLNWVVAADGRRIFHGGDTLFHGFWWRIARLGPFDAVFLPVNGAVVDAPHLQPPSPVPAALDPGQAAAAAEVLGARIAVPLHYDEDQPAKVPGYVEAADPEAAFRAHAGERARVLAVGEWLDLGGLAA